MCGIFGLIAKSESGLSFGESERIINHLFRLSETRGKESAGIAIKDTSARTINVLKQDIPATELIRTRHYQNYFKESVSKSFGVNGQGGLKEGSPVQSSFAVIAHSRLVTNGTQENNNNNQPVIKSGGVAVHNGIVTNVNDLWSKYGHELQRSYEVDTEILVDLIRLRQKQGSTLTDAVRSVFREMEGAASMAFLAEDNENVLLVTNTGSLYYCLNEKENMFVFGSERYILETLASRLDFENTYGMRKVEWMHPFTGKVLNLRDFSSVDFDLNESTQSGNNEQPSGDSYRIRDLSREEAAIEAPKINLNTDERYISLLEHHDTAINALRRCSRCILPETFPFIAFDEKGVCNYCNNYVLKNQGGRVEELKEILEKHKSKDGGPDCVVSFSGGRDSSYGLHFVKEELGMNPITFTYDWGMVTDLARRNIARVCGKLGVENILVSADIKMKRENIRKNVTAWLKRPDLGIIPLFMAGDKQFFYYANKIKKETGVKIDIWSSNRLENTDFKVGLCGVSPNFDKKRIDHLSLGNKIRLAGYYLRQFLLTPSYFNASIKDTLSSFWSYYAEPRIGYHQLFDYIKWDEPTIEDVLLNEYNWETSPDTRSTWRIGDGTAPFYNYIYFNVTGFSEIDTFRSNQIREGMLDREEALKLAREENRPRYASMKWYCDIIGVDFEHAIKTVNNIPKFYDAG